MEYYGKKTDFEVIRVGISKNHPPLPYSGESYGSTMKWFVLQEWNYYCSERFLAFRIPTCREVRALPGRKGYRRKRGFHLIVIGEPKETWLCCWHWRWMAAEYRKCILKLQGRIQTFHLAYPVCGCSSLANGIYSFWQYLYIFNIHKICNDVIYK